MRGPSFPMVPSATRMDIRNHQTHAQILDSVVAPHQNRSGFMS
jgi:hypothetical protein